MDNLKDKLCACRHTVYECISIISALKANETAIIFVENDGSETALSWCELLSYVDHAAYTLSKLGIREGSRVVVAMPNGIACIAAMAAVWHLGACAFILSYELPAKERDVLLGQIEPQLIIAPWTDCVAPTINFTESKLDADTSVRVSITDVSRVPAKASATGGSTGTPKIIIEDTPLEYGAVDFAAWNALTGQDFEWRLLICGSLHHSLFCNSLIMGLCMGCSVVILSHFDENLALSCIERYSINSAVLVPTMMSRIMRSPKLRETDLSSLKAMQHAGASCPQWLKEEWIELLGADNVYEFYSMSEKVGIAAIRGDEWLMHKGSVGRGFGCSIYILDDSQNPVPNGVTGNVYFKTSRSPGAHYLLDSQSLVKHDDMVSVGDLGYLDDDGYLYLVDRRSDMIISGGKNVYPAEVENVLRKCTSVKDIVVIGLPDANWGRRVHALIEPECPVQDFDLYAFASFGFRRLSNYKLPKTIELVEHIPRDGAGKVNKKLLLEDRLNSNGIDSRFKYITVPNGHQIYAWRSARRNGVAGIQGATDPAQK